MKAFNGYWHTSAVDASADADFVFSSVSKDDEVRDPTTGQYCAISSMAPSGIYVEHATASATIGHDRAAPAIETWLDYLDTPVVG